MAPRFILDPHSSRYIHIYTILCIISSFIKHVFPSYPHAILSPPFVFISNLLKESLLIHTPPSSPGAPSAPPSTPALNLCLLFLQSLNQLLPQKIRQAKYTLPRHDSVSSAILPVAGGFLCVAGYKFAPAAYF